MFVFAALAAHPVRVLVTPWCDDSFRIRIAPEDTPPAIRRSADALAASLKSKGLTDFDAALVRECGPGAEAELAPGGAVQNGNVRLLRPAPGSVLRAERVDTGGVLFEATPGFAENKAAAAPAGAGGWRTVPGKTAGTCSSEEYQGALGSAHTAADCLARVEASGLRANYAVWLGADKGCFACDLSDRGPQSSWKLRPQEGGACFLGPPVPSQLVGFYSANLSVAAGDRDEVLYGLGQGGWTPEGGCPAGGAAGARVVPLVRNGQTVKLQQRKFHVSIPYVASSAGYGFLWNMPGYGVVSVGGRGEGGAAWSAAAALGIDLWVSGLPRGVPSPGWPQLYSSYADATGHAPAVRDTALAFWQSRNRYKSSDIALSIAERYAELDLELGVLVIVLPVAQPARAAPRPRSPAAARTTRTSCTTGTLPRTPRATPRCGTCPPACGAS